MSDSYAESDKFLKARVNIFFSYAKEFTMVKRKAPQHNHTMKVGGETQTFCLTIGAATIRAGVEESEEGASPFIALSNDDFRDAKQEDPDLLITVGKDGPKLVVRSSIERFSFDLIALARKLVEYPEMGQTIGREGMRLGQDLEQIKGD